MSPRFELSVTNSDVPRQPLIYPLVMFARKLALFTSKIASSRLGLTRIQFRFGWGHVKGYKILARAKRKKAD